MNRESTTSTVSTKISAILGLITLALIFFVPPPKPVGARSANPPTAKTGASGESTCFQCHNDFADNDPQMLFDLIPDGSVTSYVPGDTLAFAVAIGRTASACWGFELTALTSGNLPAGTLLDDNPFVGKQTPVSGREYIGQTTSKGFDGTFAGQANGTVWGFEWIAPAAGAGTVTFYFSGVAADNDGGNGGDYVLTKTLSLTEGSTTAATSSTWGEIKQIYR